MGKMDSIDFLISNLRDTKNYGDFFDSMNTGSYLMNFSFV